MKRILFGFLFLLIPSSVFAVNIQICFMNPPIDVTTVRVYIAGVKAIDDILATSVTATTSTECGTAPSCRCTVTGLPTAATRGVTQDYTVRGVNAFNEEGPASPPLAFRAPLIPGVIQVTKVAPVVP